MQVCCIDTPLPLTDVEKMKREADRIKAFIKDIQTGKATEDTYEYIVQSLVVTDDLVQTIDNANDFYNIGGFGLLLPLLEIPRAKVIAATSEVIADLVQNNAYCQQKALEEGLLAKLLGLLKHNLDATACIKSLYAVSCLCRHNDKIVGHLENLNAMNVLLQVIQRPVEKLRTKTAFLLTHLSNHEPKIRDALYHSGFVKISIKLLEEEHDSSHEHLLSALLSLVQNHALSRSECSKEQKLKDILETKLQAYKGKSEYLEAEAYCTALKNICFPEK